MKELSTSSPAQHLPMIDAARGVAAASVVLFHSLGSLPATGLHPILAFIQTFTQHGWLGVHVFFALSGWCMAERFSAALRRGERPSSFLRDRFLRIYPAYWIALLIAIILRLAASPFNQIPPAESFPASLLAWFGDLSLIHVALGSPVYLLVSWTLFYELTFYAITVLALTLRSNHRIPSIWLLIAGSLICLWPYFGWLPNPLRALDCWMNFYVGILAWVAARRSLGWAGWSSLAVAAFASILLASQNRFGPGDSTAWLVAGLLWIAEYRPRLAAALSPAPLVSLGLVSYSLFLIHVPILSPLINLAGRHFPLSSVSFVAAWVAVIIFTFAVGYGFHRLVEAPFEKWRRHFGRAARTKLIES